MLHTNLKKSLQNLPVPLNPNIIHIKKTSTKQQTPYSAQFNIILSLTKTPKNTQNHHRTPNKCLDARDRATVISKT